MARSNVKVVRVSKPTKQQVRAARELIAFREGLVKPWTNNREKIEVYRVAGYDLISKSKA